MVWVENFIEIKAYSEGFIKGFGWSGLGVNFRAVCACPVLARFANGWQVVAITLTARVKSIWPDHTEPTTLLCATGHCAIYPWWQRWWYGWRAIIRRAVTAMFGELTATIGRLIKRTIRSVANALAISARSGIVTSHNCHGKRSHST